MAWRPDVPGVVEVMKAQFVEHQYPAHTHDTWTILIVEYGAIRYDLDRSQHGAAPSTVTALPPQVPHTGRALSGSGFRKRVLYVDSTVISDDLIGAAVDTPTCGDPTLRRRVLDLHQVLAIPEEPLEAESRLALVAALLAQHLGSRPLERPTSSALLARRLRDILDDHVVTGITLRKAAQILDVHQDSLVRSFARAYGLPPHRYLTGRRIEMARRLLLEGMPPSDVASASGFHDQAHLTRHFVRLVGTTPGRFQRRSPEFR
ncbi:AraC family transcriptional regulator [Nocardioides lijunqiniae]|uniref:AraC family transcriptional regulator n=1 Tax=Nocardioides lijunqiniae TaxID=2760832 RepID=UPI0030B8312D